MTIHHIGYLVKELEAARAEFLKLAYELSGPVTFDPARGVDICFMSKDGYTVELVSPRDADSVVYALLKKYRNTPYHLCYVSQNFAAEVDELCQNGYTLIDEPLAAPALAGRRAAFLMSYAIGIIEIVEA